MFKLFDVFFEKIFQIGNCFVLFLHFFDDYETILQTAGQKKNGMFWEEFSPF